MHHFSQALSNHRSIGDASYPSSPQSSEHLWDVREYRNIARREVSRRTPVNHFEDLSIMNHSYAVAAIEVLGPK